MPKPRKQLAAQNFFKGVAMNSPKKAPEAASEATIEGADVVNEHSQITAEIDTKQALGFLRAHTADWDPNWFLHVAAIVPDGAIEGRAVHPDQIDTLAPWLAQRNGHKNLYFTVNPLLRDPGSKPSKPDVAALAYVHVDLDPRDHMPLDAERARLRADVDGFDVPPTELIDSGNGFGLFWRLPEPIPHNDNTDALEADNRALAKYFGADNCHNIDRLMRLPGFISLPTKVKTEKGRSPVPVPTKLLSSSSATYSLDAFAFLPRVAPKTGTADIQFDQDIDELALATRFGIHQQHDPELKLLLEGKAPIWSKDRHGSGLDHAFAMRLRILGYSPAENLLLLANYPHGKTSRVRDQEYLERTVANVYPEQADSAAPAGQQGEFYIPSFAERRRNRKPNRWQVKGRFRQGTVNIIFGSSGTYKSTTMAGLAVGLQCQPYWHDSLVENSGGGILVIAAEDDEGVVDMVEAACLEYGVADPDKVKVYITHGGFDLSKPEVIQGIKASIAAMDVPLSAIIIDTLNRNCGELDENSASDMRNFLNKLDELRGDASVYVIHHNGHTEKDRERGAYAIRCNADSSVLCTFESGIFTMEWKKLRSAPLPEPLTLKPKSWVIRQEADSTGAMEDVTAIAMVMTGEAHRNARADKFYREHPELAAGDRRKYLWTLMARILNKPGETQVALAALCKASQSSIKGALDALRGCGFIEGGTKEDKRLLALTQAGVEAMNEIELDVAAAFKAAGGDVQKLVREKPLKAVLEAKNAML